MVSERKKKLTSLNEQRNTVQSNGKYVNFGCGKNYQNGWINIDAEDNGDINLFFSTDNVIPFDSNSIDGVFSEHFIEHIDFLTGVHFMSESYRILKPKGVLRIICPDLDYVLNGLNDLKLNKLKEMFISVGDFRRLPKDISNAEVINWMFYGHGHKFIYNFECMEQLLYSVGFSKVELSSFGKSVDSNMPIERRRDESFYSLYVDAIK